MKSGREKKPRISFLLLLSFTVLIFHEHKLVCCLFCCHAHKIFFIIIVVCDMQLGESYVCEHDVINVLLTLGVILQCSLSCLCLMLFLVVSQTSFRNSTPDFIGLDWTGAQCRLWPLQDLIGRSPDSCSSYPSQAKQVFLVGFFVD